MVVFLERTVKWFGRKPCEQGELNSALIFYRLYSSRSREFQAVRTFVLMLPYRVHTKFESLHDSVSTRSASEAVYPLSSLRRVDMNAEFCSFYKDIIQITQHKIANFSGAAPHDAKIDKAIKELQNHWGERQAQVWCMVHGVCACVFMALSCRAARIPVCAKLVLFSTPKCRRKPNHSVC